MSSAPFCNVPSEAYTRGAAIEPVPGEFDVGSAVAIDKGAGVVEEGRGDSDLELECRGKLGDLRQRRERVRWM